MEDVLLEEETTLEKIYTKQLGKILGFHWRKSMDDLMEIAWIDNRICAKSPNGKYKTINLRELRKRFGAPLIEKEYM